jgi:hypothetical protein
MTTAMPSPSTQPRGRAFLIVGLVLPLLALAAYAVQLALLWLTTPWYVPVLASLGVVLVGRALWQARTIWRCAALLFVGLLCGAAWLFVLATRLPAYTGPLAVDQPFPAFATTRADGSPFTQRDLIGDRDTVLVFFRGRW